MLEFISKYQEGGLLDTEAMRKDIKNDTKFYKSGAYTSAGRKRVAAIQQIDDNQESGYKYSVNEETKTFNIVDSDGKKVEHTDGKGMYTNEGIGNPLYGTVGRTNIAKKEISKVIAGSSKYKIKLKPRVEEEKKPKSGTTSEPIKEGDIKGTANVAVGYRKNAEYELLKGKGPKFGSPKSSGKFPMGGGPIASGGGYNLKDGEVATDELNIFDSETPEDWDEWEKGVDGNIAKLYTSKNGYTETEGNTEDMKELAGLEAELERRKKDSSYKNVAMGNTTAEDIQASIDKIKAKGNGNYKDQANFTATSSLDYINDEIARLETFSWDSPNEKAVILSKLQEKKDNIINSYDTFVTDITADSFSKFYNGILPGTGDTSYYYDVQDKVVTDDTSTLAKNIDFRSGERISDWTNMDDTDIIYYETTLLKEANIDPKAFTAWFGTTGQEERYRGQKDTKEVFEGWIDMYKKSGFKYEEGKTYKKWVDPNKINPRSYQGKAKWDPFMGFSYKNGGVMELKPRQERVIKAQNGAVIDMITRGAPYNTSMLLTDNQVNDPIVKMQPRSTGQIAQAMPSGNLAVPTPIKAEPMSIEEQQQQLIDAGYDLGPSGADGKWGPMSQAALEEYSADQVAAKGEDTADIAPIKVSPKSAQGLELMEERPEEEFTLTPEELAGVTTPEKKTKTSWIEQKFKMEGEGETPTLLSRTGVNTPLGEVQYNDVAQYLFALRAKNKKLDEVDLNLQKHVDAGVPTVTAARDMDSGMLNEANQEISNIRSQYQGSDPVMNMISSNMAGEAKSAAKVNLISARAGYRRQEEDRVAGEQRVADQAASANLQQSNAVQNANNERTYQAELAIAQDKARRDSEFMNTVGSITTGMQSRANLRAAGDKQLQTGLANRDYQTAMGNYKSKYASALDYKSTVDAWGTQQQKDDANKELKKINDEMTAFEKKDREGILNEADKIDNGRRLIPRK